MPRELLIRAVDQRDTYLAWRWLDRPRNVKYSVVDAGALSGALAGLDEALPRPLRAESIDAAARRALIDGPFADPVRELSLARILSETMLPDGLAAELALSDGRPSVRLRITPSRRLARVPWELLVLPDGRRLLEVADVFTDPPAVLHVKRGRLPGRWKDLAEHPVLYVLDPQTHCLPPVLDDAYDAVEAWLDQRRDDGRIRPDDREAALFSGAAGREWLGRRLRGHAYSRLLYYGHASAADQEPGSAAIHLADSADVYGLAAPIAGHRPFTALDILVGTAMSPGHRIWPMPPRVALIGCNSGGDYQYHEPFGLVISCLNAGAELVSATRWTLPTDRAFALFASCTTPGFGPTTELVINVDRCHDGADAPRLLSDWQREKLHAWINSGRMSDTPLVWASMTTHLALGRNMVA
ncbi:CHAT domain-containing protein [Streptosporangiaceae bacterium NEAU-GS5]|nr:CHAT domain-containing protein [Streptosporangiaceae bacterium NEAU-GS5]